MPEVQTPLGPASPQPYKEAPNYRFHVVLALGIATLEAVTVKFGWTGLTSSFNQATGKDKSNPNIAGDAGSFALAWVILWLVLLTGASIKSTSQMSAAFAYLILIATTFYAFDQHSFLTGIRGVMQGALYGQTSSQLSGPQAQSGQFTQQTNPGAFKPK
jgi:hypothetical protein